MEIDDDMEIDNDAKLKIPLYKLKDDFENYYYIGKLQFPGTLDFERGASFMVFIADEEAEELQIGPVDEGKRSSRINRASSSSIRTDKKVCIDMHAHVDANEKTFYVGEAECPAGINLRKGIFITFFCSKKGKEELQIGRLKHRRKDRPERQIRGNMPRYETRNIDHEQQGNSK